MLKLTGADFDREYLRFMADAHQRAVANIDGHIAEIKNTELAALLREVKPILERHGERAHEAQQQASATRCEAGALASWPSPSPTG